MKKYKIANVGCDKTNWFDIELTDKELKLVIKLLEANNKAANYICKPSLYIFEYDENKKDFEWDYTEDLRLNRDYEKLNKEN